MSDVLTVSSLLVRINVRIAELRRALGHRHDDEPRWQARAKSACEAQGERAILRQVANLLHVERATRRERIHGAFATLEDQRTWLAAMEHRRCSRAARYAGVPDETTLVILRAGIALEIAA